ncbi:MAG: Ig-like domain-containing protein, partial [Campylobacterota bacterium]
MKKIPPNILQRLALATLGLGLFATSAHAIGQCSSTHSSDYSSANDKTATTECFYKLYGNDRTVGLRVDIEQDRIFADPNLFQNTFKTTPTYQEENLVANEIANKTYIKKETCKDTPPTSGLYYTDFESSSTYCSYFIWSGFMITVQADTQSSVSDDLVNIQGNYVSLNDAPVITQGSSVNVTMSEDADPTPFNLELNATDADGDTITWSIDSNPNNGDANVSDTPTGQTQTISYTPTENFNGTDSFVVKASGGAESTITVNV